MRKLFAILLLPTLAGCLSAHVPEVSHWNVVPVVAEGKEPSKSPSFGVTRLAQIVVCAPYDDRGMTVYRKNGTLAEDAYNLFASLPSRLLKEPARTLLGASGRFEAVVGASSSATVSHIVEVTVTDLRLDCSRDDEHPDRREAVAEVHLIVLDQHRNIVGTARSAARADARDGNFGSAFSRAFTRAIQGAASEL